MVKEIESLDDFKSLIKGDKPVVVDFTASWCGPCRIIGPKYAEMESVYSNVVFIKVDVDKASDIAEHCGISAMPTFKVFKGGEEVEELVGASEGKLKEMIEKYNS